MRQVTPALLTRPPLSHPSVRRLQGASFDLHVLGTPPAFILSQDQTLMLKVLIPGPKLSLAKLQTVLLLFGSYTFKCIRSEFSQIQGLSNAAFVFRIFRVLHTVQSLIFKVLFVVGLSAATSFTISRCFLFVNNFFYFFNFLFSCF